MLTDMAAVLYRRYCVEPPATYRVISQELGISQQYARGLVARGMARLTAVPSQLRAAGVGEESRLWMAMTRS